jgi:hypothetical protein
MNSYSSGSTTGTGAALNVSLGFTPQRVRLWNPKTGAEVIWIEGMTEATVYAKNDVYTSNGLLSDPRPAIGSTKDYVATGAFNYQISGTTYTKAAVSAGTGPTATTIPMGKYGLFSFEIGADGTIDAGPDATANATGYATAAAAIAALPSPSSAHCLCAYVVVTNSATDFVGNTTNFDATGVTATYYTPTMLTNTTSGGITPIDPGDSTSVAGGFTIGTMTSINVLGDTIYYEAWR